MHILIHWFKNNTWKLIALNYGQPKSVYSTISYTFNTLDTYLFNKAHKMTLYYVVFKLKTPLLAMYLIVLAAMFGLVWGRYSLSLLEKVN